MSNQSISKTLKQAAELTGDERERFLAELPERVQAEVRKRLSGEPFAAAVGGQPELPPTLIGAVTGDVAPTYVGPYRIVQPIGKGGMGQVFMAEQTEPVKRRVALKVIKTDTPTNEILARFEAERQALAMMDHQNIAKVLDAGITEDGRPYFAMELVKGVAVTEYCDKNKLTPDARLDLFVQTCRAIQHAHQKGIIHRDIKPSNVLVTLYDGKPVAKVIDFGLAKALQDTTQLTNRTLFTQYGQVVGTLAYMSPEQAEMNALDVDTRTDVYSLGVVLYELLTGSTPITREKIKSEAFDRILALIREEEAPRPSSRLSESGDAISGISEQRKTEPKHLSSILKGDLDWIAVKALEKDRTRRYDTPASLADDVERYLNDDVIEARPPSLGYQLSKSFRKYKARFFVAGTIVGLLSAGLAGTGTMWFKAVGAKADAVAEAGKSRAAEKKARDSEENERLARLDVEKERNAVQAERDHANATLARSNYFLAVARWDANRAKEANEFLDLVPEKHRHLEWRLAKRQFHGGDLTCYGHTESVYSVCFSPDGSRLVSAGQDDSVKLWDATTGAELRTLHGHTDDIWCVRFSPDGEQVASASQDSTVKLWDASTGEEIKTLKGKDQTTWLKGVTFSHDGTVLAAARDNNTMEIWDVSTGTALRTVEVDQAILWCLAMSPDGTRLATGGADNTIKLWDASTGKQLRVLNGHTQGVESVSFSPDGNRLASASWDSTIKLWDVDTGEERRSLKGHIDSVLGVSFSPDGSRLASASEDNTVRLWDASTGAELRIFNGHTSSVSAVSFSPDGARLVSASSDNTVRVWDAVGDDAATTLRGHSDWVNSVRFSPDGTRLASADRDGALKAWDVVTGGQLWSVDNGPGSFTGFNGLRVSLDGTTIATGSDDDMVATWDFATGQPRKKYQGHTGDVRGVDFSPDGRQLASVSQDKTVRLWDASSGKELLRLSGHANGGSSVVFSPDGKRLASASREIILWDSSTGEQLKTLQGHRDYIPEVTFSPDGTKLVSACQDETVKIWDVETGDEIHTLKGHARLVKCVVYSPDGTRLATGSYDNTIRLWDTATGEELRAFRAATDTIMSIQFSPDGTRLVSASMDKTIKLWNALATTELRTLRGQAGWVTSISFSLDGRRLFSESRKGRIVWDVVAGRRLEGAEWNPPTKKLSRNGRWLAIAFLEDVMLIDMEAKNTPREKAYRTFKALPQIWWHEEQAEQAIASKSWFAATFHSAWLLKLKPNSKSAYEQLRATHSKLDPEIARFGAPAITEAMALPEPK